MPTLTDIADRHTVIDKREGQYLCFPDVLRTGNGNLLIAYNEFDKHVGTRRKLIIRESADNGRTWGEMRRMEEGQSHCPRLTRLASGEVLLLDDAGPFIHRSTDNGMHWETTRIPALAHGLLDRVTEIGEGTLLTTGHMHRGSYPHPAIRQANAEQMTYCSADSGRTWTPLSVITRQRNLVLCEASMVMLPDDRIIALMRENSFVYEPMYLCISDDLGGTWSDPMPTPLIGHRPTIGITPDGRLLVTYRNVGPNMGTCAWLGTLDELTGDFKVHGRHANPENPTLTPEGLRIFNEAGPESVVRYALRPLTDPRSAIATLEAEVRVDMADENGCGLRLGTWWKIYPDRIVPDAEEATPVPLEPGRFNTIRLDYTDGTVTLSVNGEKRSRIRVDKDHANTRPILFGAIYPFEDNAVDCVWKQVRLNIIEPAMQRTYGWEWKAADGLPDQWALDSILELRNDRDAASPDFGYSGWTTLDDGSFFCAYHHGGGNEKSYEPMHSAHVLGTRFSVDDFR